MLLLAAPSIDSVCETLLRRRKRNKKKKNGIHSIHKKCKRKRIECSAYTVASVLEQDAAPHIPTSNLREQKTQIQLKSFHENKRTAQNGPDECVCVQVWAGDEWFECVLTVPLANGMESYFRLETSSQTQPKVCFECWKCFCVNRKESRAHAHLRRSSKTTICHCFRCGSSLSIAEWSYYVRTPAMWVDQKQAHFMTTLTWYSVFRGLKTLLDASGGAAPRQTEENFLI